MSTHLAGTLKLLEISLYEEFNPYSTNISASKGVNLSMSNSELISIDNDSSFLEIAKAKLGFESRLSLILTDGAKWIGENRTQKFDFIFADTWHGKYLLLDEVLSMLKKGGLYIIDDMVSQPNWPEGHQEKAIRLIEYLETREDFFLTKQVWATGIIIAVKR